MGCDLKRGHFAYGESERGIWEEKNTILSLALMSISRIRHRMQRQSMFNYSQEFLNMGYKELNIQQTRTHIN
jgi:kynurenine 3-monooxygenase